MQLKLIALRETMYGFTGNPEVFEDAGVADKMQRVFVKTNFNAMISELEVLKISRGGTLTVAYVEDDLTFQDMIGRFLARRGITLRAFSTIDAFTQALAEPDFKPDALILDGYLAKPYVVENSTVPLIRRIVALTESASQTSMETNPPTATPVSAMAADPIRAATILTDTEVNAWFANSHLPTTDLLQIIRNKLNQRQWKKQLADAQKHVRTQQTKDMIIAALSFAVALPSSAVEAYPLFTSGLNSSAEWESFLLFAPLVILPLMLGSACVVNIIKNQIELKQAEGKKP